MNVREYLGHVGDVLRALPVDPIHECVTRIYRAYQEGRTVFVIGNGGSAAAASHLAQDLAKGVIWDQAVGHRIRALSLTDNVSYMTAVANDHGFESVFSAQLRTFATDGDLLIAISASGQSRNILQAVAVAKSQNMSIIGITGGHASSLQDASDLVIRVPVVDVGLIEGVHAVIFHYIVSSLRTRVTGIPVQQATLVPVATLQPI